MFADHNVTSINIPELLPNQSYYVLVRAYTSETLHNQSLPLKIMTELIPSTSKPLFIESEAYPGRSLNEYVAIPIVAAKALILTGACIFIYRRRTLESELDESTHEYEGKI